MPCDASVNSPLIRANAQVAHSQATVAGNVDRGFDLMDVWKP